MLDPTVNGNGQTRTHWETLVLATVEANRLASAVESVTYETSPKPYLEVTCTTAAHAEDLAAKLAGNAATLIGCYDSPDRRRYAIAVIGTPVTVVWYEAHPITPTRGTRDAWRTQPVPSAIPSTPGSIL